MSVIKIARIEAGGRKEEGKEEERGAPKVLVPLSSEVREEGKGEEVYKEVVAPVAGGVLRAGWRELRVGHPLSPVLQAQAQQAPQPQEQPGKRVECPPGYVVGRKSGRCVPIQPPPGTCPPGMTWVAWEEECISLCPPGRVWVTGRGCVEESAVERPSQTPQPQPSAQPQQQQPQAGVGVQPQPAQPAAGVTPQPSAQTQPPQTQQQQQPAPQQEAGRRPQPPAPTWVPREIVCPPDRLGNVGELQVYWDGEFYRARCSYEKYGYLGYTEPVLCYKTYGPCQKREIPRNLRYDPKTNNWKWDGCYVNWHCETGTNLDEVAKKYNISVWDQVMCTGCYP